MDNLYVALIRGINVGQAKRLAMADLRSLMARLGYRDCKTLLNSGNVVFAADGESPVDSARRVEQGIAESFGFEAPVTVLSAADLAIVVEENTLVEITENPSRLLVSFLMEPADLGRLEPLTQEDWKPEALALGSRTAYLWMPDGVIKSSLNEAVSRALDKAVTARNWKTVLRIQSALEELGHPG